MIARASVLLLALGATVPAQAEFQLRELRRIRCDGGTTTAIGFGPGVLACGGKQGDVVFFDLESREKVGEIAASSGRVLSVVFDPTGRRFATIGLTDVRVWSWPERQQLWAEPAYTQWKQGHHGVAWHPSRPLLAFFTGERDVCLVDAESGRTVKERTVPGRELRGMSFTRDGERLVLGRDRGKHTVWSWSDDELRRQGDRRQATPQPWIAHDERWITQAHFGTVSLGDTDLKIRVGVVAASRNGRYFVAGGVDAGLTLFDADLEVREITDRAFPQPGMWTELPSLAVSDDGRYIARCDPGVAVTLWRDGREVAELRGNAAEPTDVVFDGTGMHVALCCAGRAWAVDVRTGRRHELGDADDVARGWEPGTVLFLREGGIYAQRISDDEPGKPRLVHHEPGVVSITPAPRTPGSVLMGMGAGEFGGISVLRTAHDVVEFDDHRSSLRAWSRDGSRTVVGARHFWWGGAPAPTVQVHDGANGAELWQHEDAEEAHSIAMSPDGSHVAWTGQIGLAVVKIPDVGGEPEFVRSESQGRWLTFFDRRRILTHDGEALRMVDAATLETLQEIDLSGAGPHIGVTDLAPARNRIAFATQRDVIVYALERVKKK